MNEKQKKVFDYHMEEFKRLNPKACKHMTEKAKSFIEKVIMLDSHIVSLGYKEI